VSAGTTTVGQLLLTECPSSGLAIALWMRRVHLRMLAADEHLLSGDCCDNASAWTVDLCKASQALADIAELLQCERFSYVKLPARHDTAALHVKTPCNGAAACYCYWAMAHPDQCINGLAPRDSDVQGPLFTVQRSSAHDYGCGAGCRPVCVASFCRMSCRSSRAFAAVLSMNCWNDVMPPFHLQNNIPSM